MTSSAFSFHCMICFEEFDPATNYPVVLPCGHTYVCVSCANRLDKCMECRISLVSKIELPGASAGSPEVGQKENVPARYSSARYSRGTYQSQHLRGATAGTMIPPQKQFVTQRLPLPKNAVLLSLIQASEPARRRAEEAQMLPEMPSSPRDPSRTEHKHLPKSSAQGFDHSISLSNDAEISNTTGIIIDDSDDEEQKIRVGTHLEGGPCGTYAVAVKTGLLVYPTLFEHTFKTQNKNDSEDEVTRDVEELVKSSYRKKHCVKRGGGGSNESVVRFRNSVSPSKGIEKTTHIHTWVSSDEDERNVHEDSREDRRRPGDREVVIAIEAQFSPKTDRIDEERLKGADFEALSDPGGKKMKGLPLTILPKHRISNDSLNNTHGTIIVKNLTKTLMPVSPLSKSEHSRISLTTPTTEADILSAPSLDANSENDPSLSATLKLRRQFSHGAYPVSSSNGEGDDFDRPLIRLKYGDRVQVVSMDSRGWVKLARGYGYIRLENDKQLVKVGGTSDKACQIEAVLHELSIERNRLKNEQKKLERLSAGLMIDLQSSLLTSDDTVIVQAPETIPRIESELSISPMKKMDRQSSNVSQDDTVITCRRRTSPRESSSHNGHKNSLPGEIRTAKSHSPGRNYISTPTPPSPPYVNPYVMTPTRVNFRTGLSGHRALSSSHSHPHDFISVSGPSRSMSNHAGLSSKKSSNGRGRTSY